MANLSDVSLHSNNPMVLHVVSMQNILKLNESHTVGREASEILTLEGPASKLDTTIIYNIGHCQVSCVCSICNSPPRCTRRTCADNPCENCDTQCCRHKIGIARLFDDDEDMFTVNVKNGNVTNQSNLFDLENCGIKKYACIPKTCAECR